MLQQLRTSIVVLALLTLLTGVVYPGLVTAIAQLAFPHQANGSILQIDGKAVGSEFDRSAVLAAGILLGTAFGHGSVPYNAAASSGSNFGPLHPALVKNAKARIEALASRGSPGGVDSGRSGHRFRQRSGPAHQPGGRRSPGAPCCRGAEDDGRCSARACSAAHRSEAVGRAGRASGECPSLEHRPRRCDGMTSHDRHSTRSR